MDAAQPWYEESYAQHGLKAQRQWPNEELCRFMGRHFFGVPEDQRKNVRILEVGCGSGGNLWMIAKEGFDAWGFDYAAAGIESCREILAKRGVTANIKVGDMRAIDYPAGSFDAVVDVLSSYCLDDAEHGRFLEGVRRLLKPGGRFFSYTPGKGSTDWKGPGNVMPAPGGPLVYPGNDFPFRYTTVSELRADLETRGFGNVVGETVTRSYGPTVVFEYVVVSAQTAQS